MTQIELSNMSKSYGSVEVMHDINLEIADGEFIVLVGLSGCGKSTLLRMIVGLEPISGGDSVGQVEVIERLGSDSNLYINVENLPQLQVRYSGNTTLEAGEECGIKVDLAQAHIFNQTGNRVEIN